MNPITTIPIDFVMEIPAGGFLLASTSCSETRREGSWTTGSGRRERREGRRLSVRWLRVTCIEVGAMSEASICMRTDDRPKMNAVADTGDSLESPGGSTVVLGNVLTNWLECSVGFELGADSS